MVACIELYRQINDETFVEIDPDVSFASLRHVYRSRGFLRVVLEGDVVVAWIYCQPVSMMHVRYLSFQQIYYASSKTGLAAVKLVKLLHEAMLEEARRLKIQLAISMGSHMDSKHTFVRILEKAGWQRRGHAAIFRLRPPTGQTVP